MAKASNELEPVIKRAKELSRERDEERFVILMESGDTYKWYQCDESYLDSAEYNAFDGHVCYAVYPDGEVQTL